MAHVQDICYALNSLLIKTQLYVVLNKKRYILGKEIYVTRQWMSPEIFPVHPEIHFLIRWRQKSEGRLSLASSSGQFQNPDLEHSAWSCNFDWRFASIFVYFLVIEPFHFLIVVFAFRIAIKLLTKNLEYNQRNNNFVALLSFCVLLYFWIVIFI